jgi:hypothetical protein
MSILAKLFSKAVNSVRPKGAEPNATLSVPNQKFGGLYRLDDSRLSRFWGGLTMDRRFAPLELNEVERAELTSLASRGSTAQALALRALIVLALACSFQVFFRTGHLSLPSESGKP